MYTTNKHSQVLAIAMPVLKLAATAVGIIIVIFIQLISNTVSTELTHPIMTIFKELTETLVQDGKTWIKF